MAELLVFLAVKPNVSGPDLDKLGPLAVLGNQEDFNRSCRQTVDRTNTCGQHVDGGERGTMSRAFCSREQQRQLIFLFD
jgi:hypothetical protein